MSEHDGPEHGKVRMPNDGLSNPWVVNPMLDDEMGLEALQAVYDLYGFAVFSVSCVADANVTWSMLCTAAPSCFTALATSS